ncbi:NAD(P)H-dependent oxidoreductase [Thalassotalea fusca]
MSKNVLILNGNPKSQSFCSELARRYADGCKVAGHRVQILDIQSLNYNPSLVEGYSHDQPLEEDLLRFQRKIEWANHIVIVHPVWWGMMPSVLKGLLDRVFLPGFAFRFVKGSRRWEKLLKNKTAHVISTLDTPAWYYHLVYRAPALRALKNMTLEFCGISPVKSTTIGSLKHLKPEQKTQWLERVYNYGQKFS